MSGYKYDEDLHHINKIQFSVFTNDDIKDYSSVMKDTNGINLPESYENSEPKRGGLVDTRLGITDANLDCAYCGLGAKDCPGHFGHTKLVAPVFHYGFFPIVKNILSCICLRSSRLLAHKTPEELNKIVRLFKGKRRFNEIKKLSSGISVSDVGVPVPKIKEEKKKNSGALYLVAETSLSNVIAEDGTMENNKPVREKITASDVYNIFRNISDDDFRLLGFNPSLFRPEDLLLINFPVPPVAIRPSLRADYLASATYEDDLTHKLADIIKTNEKYRQQKEKELVSGEESKYGSDLHNYLQYHVITYFDNDKSSFLTSEQKVGNKKFKSISERIKSKKGRIRGNLMGKRVNFSARSVITSDPNLKLNELGIPKKIAMEITFPEVVTAYNVERLTKLVRNGRYVYPGANYVIQGSSLGSANIREYDLRYRKKSIKLKYGDIVERHLYNGDPVLFNRQPSLHKLSMMCHRAKIIDDERFNTFRLNVNVTPPYNADFDGDEMNLFAPQSIQTQTELALIADINKLIISPKDSEPIIEPVQDSVLGTYKMTSPTSEVDWHDFMNIAVHCVGIDLEKLKIEKNKTYTGTQLYNIIIPDQINLNTSITVTNGDIVKGQVRKKANKQIISNCWDRHGPKITADYITDIQKLNVNWILYDGFSVGLADCYINKEVKNKIISELEKKKLEIAHLITEIENNPELLDADIFEQSIKSNLAAQKGDIQQLVMNDLDDNNNFFIMANSGAKGKPVNIMQIMGALGQDIFKGKRIEKEVNNRTLPHFHQNDDTPLARGYIEHSYLDGLSPQEFFFHHMTGREGLIDTAIKTAETGYISRKLMKGLEDIGAKYDGTVRTGNNMILQYIYSDFNLDQTKQKLIKLKTIEMGDSELDKQYSLSEAEIKKIVKESKGNLEILRQLNKKYMDDLIGFRNLMRITQRVMNLNYKTLLNEFHFAVNLPRIIADEIALVRDEDNNEFCTPKHIIDQIEYLLKPDVTQITTFNDTILNDKDSVKMKDEQRSKLLFKYYLYEYLSPKKILFEHNLTKYKFDKVIEQIILDFKKSQVDAGEMVGCLAAQHMGEPSTQMTLNTFHATGSGSAAMQGVPRVEELTRATKNIKTPEMTIYLDKKIREDRDKANIISSNIQYTIIKDLVLDYEMIYDIDTDTTGYTKKDNVSNPFFVNLKSGTRKYENMIWLLRIKLDRNKIIEKNVTTLDIKSNYIKFFKNYLGEARSLKRHEKKILNAITGSCILSNFDNNDDPIIHIRFDMIEFNSNLLLSINEWIINNFKLKGLDDISKTDIDSSSRLISFENKDNAFEESNEIVIYTQGINMTDIRYIEGIDLNRTYCNEINTIYKYFGIEAARSALLKELYRVFSDQNVNYHHLAILVDTMTNLGFLTSIDRHGINKLDTDPLSRASFEMPIEQLTKAAMFGEIDYMRSVSSRVMAGRVISGGTGLCSLLLDTEYVMNSEYVDDETAIQRSEFNMLEDNAILTDIISRTMFDIFKPKLS
jgi:DNA-directed RNA polymerase II subunit RPB1